MTINSNSTTITFNSIVFSKTTIGYSGIITYNKNSTTSRIKHNSRIYAISSIVSIRYYFINFCIITFNVNSTTLNSPICSKIHYISLDIITINVCCSTLNRIIIIKVIFTKSKIFTIHIKSST